MNGMSPMTEAPTIAPDHTRAPIGLIVPPASGAIPPDAPLVYPGIEFIARGLGLVDLSHDGYSGVVGSIGDAAVELVRQGAGSVALMGTSLSFFRGIAFNAELEHEIASRTGRPSVTMSTGIVAACAALDMRRLAVATAYEDAVNDKLREYLAAAGLETVSLEHLGIGTVDEVHRVPEDVVTELGRRAYRAGQGVDGILISCGGLATRAAVRVLEAETGLPVVTSPLAGLWAAVVNAGYDPRAEDHGRLFQASLPDAPPGRRHAAHSE